MSPSRIILSVSVVVSGIFAAVPRPTVGAEGTTRADNVQAQETAAPHAAERAVRVNRTAREKPSVRIIRSADGTRVDAPTTVTIERTDDVSGGPVRVIYSVQSPRYRGLAAGGDGRVVSTSSIVAGGGSSAAGAPSSAVGILGAEAKIFEQIRATPFGVFLNFGPSTGAYFPGAMLADNMGLDSGLPVGGPISSYTLSLFRSSLDPQPGLADVHVELWDGDPFCGLDTPGGGFACASIPGTEADFVDIAANTRVAARAELPAGVTLSPSNTERRVWMVLSGSESGVNPSPCRLGWDISALKPSIGNDLPLDVYAIQQDSDGTFNGLGTCCNDGATPCQSLPPPNFVEVCPGDTASGKPRGFCSDGHAEDPVFANFNCGGVACPCTGDPDWDFCANFVASIFAPAKVTMSLVPTGNDKDGGLAPGATIVGNEIRLRDTDATVFLEVRFSDWDPDDIGTRLKAYGARLDSSGYTSGLQGTLSPKRVACSAACRGGPFDGSPCTGNEDCGVCLGGVRAGLPCGGNQPDCLGDICEGECDFQTDTCRAAFGGVCGGNTPTLGAPCLTDNDCPDINPPVFVGLCQGPPCAFPEGIGGFCDPAFILSARQDYVFFGINNFPGVDTSRPSFAAIVSSDAKPAPDPFPAGGAYAGTLVLDVSAEAKGTFEVGFLDVPSSALVAEDNSFIPLLGLVPAKINVIGADCNRNGIHDSQDILDGTSVDLDGNGVPDECQCPPAPPQAESPVVGKSRYLSFVPGNAGIETALRVTFESLPGSFAELNGKTMWVGPPREVSELGALTDDTPPTFTAATLQCEPFFADWSASGTIHVYHRNIVPEAVYSVQSVGSFCDLNDPSAFSSPLTILTPRWTDIVGAFVNGQWAPPDGSLDITDRIAVIDRFASRPGSVSKVRADLHGETPDQRIGVLDLVMTQDAFRGFPYPFTIDPTPCGN